ncbi:MAG: Gfo/Idh/MocA family oxidoreductase [Armatimonadetes bacterium]|nr:Gfo/Idh/MocA family oxidoreductase [Armatimonadota bacterium]
MSGVLGVGVIGCGSFGNRVMEAVSGLPEVRLIGIADARGEKLDAATRRWAARPCRTIDQLLEDPRVSIVAIVTPPFLHAAHALAAIGAGKHVFTAEPLGADLDQAATVVTMARIQGLQVAANLPLRYVPAYRVLRLLVKGGTLGRLTYLGVENHISMRGLPVDHWAWDRERSGGFLAEGGLHFFDLANHLLAAPPLSVAGVAHTTADGEPDGALVNVQYPNEVLASFYHLYQEQTREDVTALRLSFEEANIALHGWIPSHMDVEGMSAEAAGQLAGMLGRQLERVEASPLDDTQPREPLMRVPLSQGPPLEGYLAALRGALNGLVRAIRNPLATPAVSPQDILEGLRLALRAQDAVDQKIVVNCAV